MRSRPTLASTLYRWGLKLFPPSVYAEDGDEMVEAFDALWREARGLGARLRLGLITFPRLPVVGALEWMEILGLIRTPGSPFNQRRWGMASWGGNVRLALRTLRKAPGFTTTTILLLGLGIGSVTTIFTLVDHVVLRDLPYPAQDRLFVVENGSHPGPVFQEFQNMNSVELWGAALSETANLVGEGDPLRVTSVRVSEDFFTLFGAHPEMGRLLVAEDFQEPNTVILSHGFWVRAFGADPGIIDRVIRIDTEKHHRVPGSGWGPRGGVSASGRHRFRRAFHGHLAPH